MYPRWGFHLYHNSSNSSRLGKWHVATILTTKFSHDIFFYLFFLGNSLWKIATTAAAAEHLSLATKYIVLLLFFWYCCYGCYCYSRRYDECESVIKIALRKRKLATKINVCLCMSVCLYECTFTYAYLHWECNIFLNTSFNNSTPLPHLLVKSCECESHVAHCALFPAIVITKYIHKY